MQGPGRHCPMCVYGMGKGVGVHQARIDTLRASCDLRNDWYNFPETLPGCGG